MSDDFVLNLTEKEAEYLKQTFNLIQLFFAGSQSFLKDKGSLLKDNEELKKELGDSAIAYMIGIAVSIFEQNIYTEKDLQSVMDKFYKEYTLHHPNGNKKN